MASRFTLPHIDISAFRSSSPYQGSGSPIDGTVRIREEHGRRLQNELTAALAAADEQRPTDDRLPPAKGIYLEVELQRGAKPDILARKTEGIRPGAVKADENNVRTVALYVPDSARAALQQILADYTSGPLTGSGKPQRSDKIGPIEVFRRARLETVWTDDPRALPDDVQHQMWWAVWCPSGAETRIENACERLGVRAAARDHRSYFPEATVIPVLATRVAIELMLFVTGDIDELRRASDNPVFFTDEVRGDQSEWTGDLAERINWPDSTAPAVCLLDTGVNRAHALIEPALSSADMHAINSEWGTDDHDPSGHGTAMAGLSLHGDLTAQLGDMSERALNHRLESVKLLPPAGFDPNEPHSYGVLTQAAISLPEISAPGRGRIFCMAVSNQDVSGAIASTWSAAIDQIAAGTMIGDGENAPRRLFVVSAGNVPPVIQMAQLQPQDNFPTEDPAQAWNALTVGGYTDLIDIQDSGYEDWSPLAGAGELSPHSRTSFTWPQGRSPFKPEIVLEAGNRAVSPEKTEVLTVDSLSLLSTGHDVEVLPLVPFKATSAATAQAARMAAMLHAEHPELWPETVRGLMVHSAEWTEPMLAAFETTAGKRDNYGLLRRFGYGVPDFDRANASAQNHLALVAQSEIQPFKRDGRKFNECHYYGLPLPASILEELGNNPINLKITLSYFVDPNPGLSANVEPQRYQSFGLRFDLRRKGETIANFKKRVNAAERENPLGAAPGGPNDNGWLLGPKSVSAGSLHCDVWAGPAIDLLGRDQICISPVNGWWRKRASPEICNKKARYSLIVTIRTPDTNVDIYTPISTAIEIPGGEIEI
jgi:hypothetical protein